MEEIRAGLQAEESLSHVADVLLALMRPAVHIQVTEKQVETELVPMGVSKLGGLPDLPEGARWPEATLDIPTPTPEMVALASQFYLDLPPPENTLSLPFIAQIRLEDVANLLPENLLPPKGTLYFFYNTATFASDGSGIRAQITTGSGDILASISYDHYGWPASQNCRVLFSNDELLPLVRQAHPESLLPPYRYDALGISFNVAAMLPGVQTAYVGGSDDAKGLVRLTNEEWDYYSEIRQELIPNMDHLLGYSQDAQPYALETSYQTFRSELFPELPDWNGLSDEERRDEYLVCSLLLQVEPHTNGMHFGRAGALYFFIRNDDLARRDFSRVWAWVQ